MIPLYLDPGSGSLLLQLLIAGLAGAVIVIGAQWRKIKRWLNRKKGEPETQVESEDDDEE